MTLPARPVHIPAGVALDEATREELLDVGKANVLSINVRSTDRGTLEKRPGFALLPEGPLEGWRLFERDGAPCVVDGERLHVYSETEDDWNDMGRVPEASLRLRDLPTPTATAVPFDSTYRNGYVAVAAAKALTGQATVSVVDYASGVTVRGPENLGGNGILLLESFGTTIVAVFQLFANVTAYLLDTTNVDAGWSAPIVITAAAANITPSVTALADRAAIVYAANAGTDRVIVATITAAGAVASTAIGTGGGSPIAVDIDAGGGATLWVTWALAGGLDETYVHALDASDITITVGTTATGFAFSLLANLRIAAGTTFQTARYFLQSGSGTNYFLEIGNVTIAAGACVIVPGTSVYNATAISRPWCIDDRYYMVVTPAPSPGTANSNPQALNVVVDWTAETRTLRPLANVEPALSPNVSHLAKANDLGDGRWIYVFQHLKGGRGGAFDLVAGLGVVSLALVELDYLDRNRWQTTELGGVEFLSGGVLSTFDGTRVVEAGFLSRPRVPAVDLTVAGGLSPTLGGYRYVAIYEDVDAAGNVTVSGVSGDLITDPIVITGNFVNKAPLLSVPTLTVTSRLKGGLPGTVRVAFYRTVDGGEPPYYRLGATVVDPSLPTTTFSDNTTDTDLKKRAKLYAPSLPGTLGESLDRRGPAGLKHIVTYNGMIVGAKGGSIVYSGQPVYGEATWFSPVFEVPISSDDITALAVLDGSLVVFQESAISILAGEIPSDNGAAGGLGQPRELATDVGCIEPASVLSTALGVFFQSRRGIELLGRSQTVAWVGEPIRKTLEAFPFVTSATLDARNSLIRFTLARTITGGLVEDFDPGNADVPASGGGRDVVFDTSLGFWISVDDKADDVDAEIGSQDAHRVRLADTWRYAYLTKHGSVRMERNVDDPLAYRDENRFVRATYALPPWKFGLQQEQRSYEFEFLQERLSEADLQISVAEDYGEYNVVTGSKFWTSAEVGSNQTLPFRTRSHGIAVQLRIRDSESPELLSPDSGRGFIYIGLSSDIAPKQGPTRGTARVNTDLRR